MTAMHEHTTASTYADMGQSAARALLRSSHVDFYRANAEREFALLVCYFAGVPTRESGPIIERDGSTAWERTKTLLRKWQNNKLEWPADILARLDGFEKPQPEEQGSQN